MIEGKKRSIYTHNTSRIVKEIKNNIGVSEITAEEVLNYIIEEYDYVFYEYDKVSKETVINRLNLCWVFPLVLITIPFQYLLFGKVGVNRNSRIGKVLDYLIGF